MQAEVRKRAVHWQQPQPRTSLKTNRLSKENEKLVKRCATKTSLQAPHAKQPAGAKKPLQSSLYENAVYKRKTVTMNSDLSLNYAKAAALSRPKPVSMGQSAVTLQQHRQSVHHPSPKRTNELKTATNSIVSGLKEVDKMLSYKVNTQSHSLERPYSAGCSVLHSENRWRELTPMRNYTKSVQQYKSQLKNMRKYLKSLENRKFTPSQEHTSFH